LDILSGMSQDRSLGLIAFGVVQILIGLACAAIVLYVASGSDVAVREGPAGGAAVASSLTAYGVAAVYFVAVGVGSIRKRRWARALSLVVSAMWLVAGIVTLLLLPALPQRTASLVVAAIIGLIAVPLALVLFYRQPSARETCEAADKPRWTDRIPLPVLAVVIMLAFGSLALLANLANPVLTLFAMHITGAPAALTLLALAILCAWLAIQIYRLHESAWWTLLLLQVIGCVVAIISLLRPTSVEVGRSPLFVTIVVATWVGYFAYLLFIRRYFAVRMEPRTRRGEVHGAPGAIS
jgi:hypothetical protein